MVVREHTITTDVLVVGAGFAGCFAAIRARELGAEVLIAEYGKAGFAGASAIGAHITRVVLPDDDHDAALKSTVLDSDYMVDQEYAEGVIAESYDIFNQCLKLGSDFARDVNTGEIVWVIGNTPNPFYQQRFALWMPWNSYKHVTNAKNGALHLGAKVLDRIVVTDLLTSGGKVVGAIGINNRDGDFYTFKAKAVILATGTAGVPTGLSAANHASYTGDGTGMALRAGAELRGMEFGKVGTGVNKKYFDERARQYGSADLAAFSLQGWGDSSNPAKIVNARGEEFLEQYELTYRRPDRFYQGPPWKRLIPAIWKELREGRGPVYQQMPRTRQTFSGEIGIGGYFLTQAGGIRINPYGVCSIPGLFAGGIASDMCCAPNYTIPANILGSQATGRRAGESAARYAGEQSEPTVDEGEIKRLKAEVYAPLGRNKGITEAEVRIKIIKAHPYLDLRNEENLNKAYEEFRQIEQDAASLKADDYHELTKCHKIRNLIQDLQATALAARERRETREDHFRHDYPFIDNKNWLKWVIVRGTGDRMETYLEDIPIDKWKYKPDPELVDPLQSRKEVR